MSYKTGKLYTCDRCGKTHLCESLLGSCEPLPDGWGYVVNIKESYDFCPDCYKNYQKLLQEFKNGKQ